MVISVTRLLNHGLLLISPVILVRLLSVTDFGRYREFLLYSTLLLSLASLGFSASLLRFVGQQPAHRWLYVDQVLLMTATSSALAIGAVALANHLTNGAVVGDYLWPVALYVGLFANFDFWEHLWLAQRRIGAVFAYTTGRLIARMTVVIGAAALTGDVEVIIWSLVVMEAVRFSISAVSWAHARGGPPAKVPGSWREQLRFCLPTGGGALLLTINRSLGSLFVARTLGPAGLAQYAIGTYVQPIIAVLRNSLSDALLPDMSAQQPGHKNPLLLWKRMTVVAAIVLVATAVVLGRFAHTIVTTIFSSAYEAAVPVFQIYVLVLLREMLDFAVPLRAMNRTAPILQSNLLSAAVNITLLMTLLPIFGVVGAAIAFVVAQMIEGTYLGWRTAQAYEIKARDLLQWRDLGKVALAALGASPVLYGSFWVEYLGFFGVMVGGCCFGLVYAALLIALRVPEARLLLQRAQQLPRTFYARRA